MGVIAVDRICGECFKNGEIVPIWYFDEVNNIAYKHNHKIYVLKKEIIDKLEDGKP